jgi:hypothetical protein
MIQATPQTKILVAVEPIDFRKRIDGTAGVCRAVFERDPYDGAMYVFRNRSRTMIRIYFFDGLVEWGCDLRIAEKKFPYWPTSSEPLVGLKAHELYILIKGGNPLAAEVLPDWKKIA